MKTLIVVPTLNEAPHIKDVIASMLNASSTDDNIHILVVDGGSTDGTLEIVRPMCERPIRLIHNPTRTQATAVNMAAKLASAEGFDVIIRVDAHARYSKDFISTVLTTLNESDAASVVVTMITEGGTPLQDAAAILYGSWLGNGGAAHRNGRIRGFVEHGHHAAFRLSAFLAVGGYDPAFVANEDAELDRRLIKNGYKIFLENRSPVRYIPRNSYSAFWRQMKRNGRYRVLTARKHGENLAPRQLIPIAIVPILFTSLLLGMAVTPIAYSGVVGYFVCVSLLAFKSCLRVKRRSIMALRVTALAIVSHVGFSFGAIESMLNDKTQEILAKGSHQS